MNNPASEPRTLKPRRSCLSVPASSARMQAKAATLDADLVILDLEDATAPSEKTGARSVVVESLRTLDFGRRGVAVRVNGADTQWCYRDVVDVVEAVGDRIDAFVGRPRILEVVAIIEKRVGAPAAARTRHTRRIGRR